MEENIEVKDVHRTEYLDKNGLDMLWAKVKENTHNQVEVERNRATTQENIIIETKADKSELHSSYVSNSTFTALEEKVSANTAAISGKQDTGNYLHYETLNNDGYYEIPSVCVINKGNRADTSITSDEIKVSDENFGYTIITMDGVSNKYATDVDFALGFNLNRNGIKLQGGDNNHVLTSNGSTIDITEYAKKTDIPEVDTSDFVIKTARDTQTIKAPLTVTGNLRVNDIDNKTYVFLSGIQGSGQLQLFNKDTSARSYLEGGSLQINEGPDDGISITCQGIRNLDDNANHVYATDGSIADLTQYVKKNEITADSNVDDVQVNGVSVVENKIANINSATKEKLGVVKVGDGLNVTDGTISVDTTAIGSGNYIPYESIAADDNINYKTYVMKHNEGILFDSASGDVSIKDGEVVVKNTNHRIAVTSSFIWLLGPNDYGEGADTLLFELNKDGLRLHNGDNNHVLTSYGSTINITQYALKSVYDKKIAALEARIAALEAKHTETA